MPKTMPDVAPAHAAIVGAHVRLGKLEVKKDSRNLRLASYTPKKLPATPTTVTRYKKVSSWPMYENDALGDCTVAAAGHLEQQWSVESLAPETPPDDLVVGTYWATGDQDDGRYCLDVLNRWHKYGLGRNGSDEKIAAFVQLNLNQTGHFRFAISEFGGAYIGLALPISAQRQTTWKVTTGANGVPGSWGGHCVPLVGYDRYGAFLVTWGAIMKATWGFLTKYCDEGYAIISPDWLDQAQNAPADAGGVNIAKLTQDLAALGA